jgi:ribosomal protein L37AE/L43A
MPVTITTGGELTDLEYRQKLGPWIRRIISTTSRRYTAGRGPRKCQCKQCVVSGDPSKAADTEIWICTSCGYAGCSLKDHGGAMEHWEKADHRFAMRIPTGVDANERLMFTQTEIWDYQQGKYLKKQVCSEPKALASICGPTLGGLAGPMLPNHKSKVGSKDIELAQERVDGLQRLALGATPTAEASRECGTGS